MPLLVLTALMIGCLLDFDRLAFRDVGFFYTPLYYHVARFDDLGSGPAWNWLDGTGMPLAGETTTAVFYPVRWIVYRLADTPTRAIAIYVWLHLLLASLTARRLAITQSGRRAGVMAGWIYPMSGSVIFLVTNVPFLVSAAWLPMAFHFLVRPRQRGTQIDSAVAIAMMILAGDPQTALHVTLVLSGWIALQAIFKRDFRILRFNLECLIKIMLMVTAISLPQAIASWDWSRQSDRDGGISAPDRYAYSIAPWRFIEYTTSNASGRFFPRNERVTAALPGDGAMWTPSIYGGAIAVPALMAGLFVKRRRSAWTLLTIVAAAASMGHFGLVWWIQTCTGLLAETPSETGGLYWMLCKCVPGYDWFRYPAKWLPMMSLGTTIVACQWIADRSQRRWSGSLVATAACMLAGYFWMRMTFQTASGKQIEDEFWGPLQVNQAIASIQFSFLVSFVTLVLLALLVALRSARRLSGSQFQICVMSIVAVDITCFASTMIPRVSIAKETAILSQLRSDPPKFESSDRGAWMRYSDWSKWPDGWRSKSDDDRLADVEASLRSSRFGRWHLLPSEPVLNSMVTIGPRAATEFWNEHRADTNQRREAQVPDTRSSEDQVWLQSREELSSVGTLDEQGTLRVIEGRSYTAAKFTSESHEFLRYDKRIAKLTRIGGQDHQAIYDVDAKSEFKLTRPVYQDGHWMAEIQFGTASQTQPRKVNREGWIQSLSLPEGRYQLRFEYRPWWYTTTCVLSLASCLAILGLKIRHLSAAAAGRAKTVEGA
jgi:hypothetical protein